MPRTRFNSPDTPSLDLARLPLLSFDELRALWPVHMGRAAPPAQKCLMMRELAWQTQARREGGFDARTQRLLQQAMNAARSAKRSEATTDDRTNPTRRKAGTCAIVRAKADGLLPGTRLVRIWRNIKHEVTVLEQGKFTYRGQTFRSLTAIAQEITGAVCSGPRFFGLTLRKQQRPSPGHDPEASS